MNSRSTKIALIAAFLAMPLVGTGCKSVPAQTGGLRMLSVEAVQGISNSSFAVAGVLVDGYIDGTPGPHNNPNGESEFTGLTNFQGIYDIPTAQTDIQWYLQFTFENVIPGCPNAVNMPYVPPQGAEDIGTCYTFDVPG